MLILSIFVSFIEKFEEKNIQSHFQLNEEVIYSTCVLGHVDAVSTEFDP